MGSVQEFLSLPGIAPLRDLLADPTVSEIMVNGPASLYVERSGRKERVAPRFRSEDELRFAIETMLGPSRREVNTANPCADFVLPDGSRVNVVLPPISLEGAVVTIRKLVPGLRTVDDLVDRGTLDGRMAEFLKAAVRHRLNVIFAGATGSGKTTTLNALSAEIDDEDRIVTIEDTAELSLVQDHVVRLETRPPNAEGVGGISIRSLFRNSLRMRPDRIIVGEVRGEEVVDMLQAIASGHDGALVVLHAGSPEEVVSRLEVLFLLAGIPLPLWAIHRQIARSIDLVVQMERLDDGTRRIVQVSELRGPVEDKVVPADLFRWENGVRCGFRLTEARPEILGRFPAPVRDVWRRTFESGFAVERTA